MLLEKGLFAENWHEAALPQKAHFSATLALSSTLPLPREIAKTESYPELEAGYLTRLLSSVAFI